MVQSDIHSDLVTLIQRLDRAEINWDAENIVDWLWLSRYVEGTTVKTFEEPPPPPELLPPIPTEHQLSTPTERTSPSPGVGLYSSASETETTTTQPASKGIPFPTPTAPALRKTLAIARSMRPLMRKVDSYRQMVLDEDATAEQTAEQQFCMTVVKPDQERWLEIALVIEESASSFLWQETIRDFKQILERQGAFRSVVVWYLQTSSQGEVTLFAKRPTQVAKPQPRSPKELIDSSNRRLILLASDCISPAWRSAQLYNDYLQPWTERGLFAIVQMLPSHLWKRTALSAALSVQLSAWSPGMLNHRLLLREIPIGSDSDPKQGLKIPVVTLEPTYLEPWGRMVSGFGESWAMGVWFDEGWQSLTPSEPSISPSVLTAEQLVQRFDTTASALAKRLAGLMSLVPVSLPIIYLLQETMLRDSTPLHMAEVFMSGLVQRDDETSLNGTDESHRTAHKVYEFVPHVRELLSSSVTAKTAEVVLNRVSQYIGNRLGKSIYSFTALLMLEQELGEDGGTELLQFAQITKQVLKRMGGGYAALVEALEEPVVSPPSVGHSPQPPADYPPLNVLNFKTARFVDPGAEIGEDNFPPIYREEFTTTAITVEPEDAPQPTDLQPFEFTVATIQRSTVARQVHPAWVIQRQQQSAHHFFEPLTITGDVLLEMVSIPGGTFLMGSPENEPNRSSQESPHHEVTVEPFFMGRYPITQIQWQFVAELMPRVNRELRPSPSRFSGSTRPVERVSWDEAVEFCARLSAHTRRTYRLPSEAEWEYACRAGTTTPFHFGETITPELANYDGTKTYNDGSKGEYRKSTTSVEHFEIANPFGLCDMHGNVFEWCQDYWHSNYEGAPTDGSAWLSANKDASRVRRGGSWNDIPVNCRSAYRSFNNPRDPYNLIGFRIVCSSPRTLT